MLEAININIHIYKIICFSTFSLGTIKKWLMADVSCFKTCVDELFLDNCVWNVKVKLANVCKKNVIDDS